MYDLKSFWPVLQGYLRSYGNEWKEHVLFIEHWVLVVFCGCISQACVIKIYCCFSVYYIHIMKRLFLRNSLYAIYCGVGCWWESVRIMISIVFVRLIFALRLSARNPLPRLAIFAYFIHFDAMQCVFGTFVNCPLLRKSQLLFLVVDFVFLLKFYLYRLSKFGCIFSFLV